MNMIEFPGDCCVDMDRVAVFWLNPKEGTADFQVCYYIFGIDQRFFLRYNSADQAESVYRVFKSETKAREANNL